MTTCGKLCEGEREGGIEREGGREDTKVGCAGNSINCTDSAFFKVSSSLGEVGAMLPTSERKGRIGREGGRERGGAGSH